MVREKVMITDVDKSVLLFHNGGKIVAPFSTIKSANHGHAHEE
jgi:hypothetical protein